jgi:hypothetical protein
VAHRKNLVVCFAGKQTPDSMWEDRGKKVSRASTGIRNPDRLVCDPDTLTTKYNNNNNNKPVNKEGDVTELWNQAVHTDREVTANRPNIIIKKKMRK